MPRNYKNTIKRGKVLPEIMMRSVKLVTSKQSPLRRVAKDFNNNYQTLFRYCQKIPDADLKTEPSKQSIDIEYKKRCVIPKEIGKKLVNHCLRASDIYYGFSPKEVGKLAYELAIANELKVPKSWTEYW